MKNLQMDRDSDRRVIREPVWLCESDRSLCLHTIIEQWAERTPNAQAVLFEGNALTYRQLNDWAAALALKLRRNNVGVGSLVGVSMKRSLEMIVGVLAILKAGAAYVPLDPRLPRERLSFMVSDAPLPVILTRHTQPEVGNALVIDVACDGWNGPTLPSADSSTAAAIGTGELAYVIYTSGSTGQPKGVMIPHRGVVNWLVWMRNTFEVTPEDVVLKKAPLTFDVSAWELFLPLISGACLVLADSDRQYDPAYLARLMATTHVTVAQFVPSLMRAFLEQPDLPDLGSLRHVMCGGEVLPPKLLALFLGRLTSDVCNSYGPTEASIGVTRFPCPRGRQLETVPIGSAIDNTQLYILDPELNPVAPGVAGELYIGGVCLGRGYLNRPDLTAERFLPNPFDAEGEARMYRTGDLCRFLDDGAIDFLGRIDDQVKIHGVRIEPGEVEKAIVAHQAVKACVVSAEERDDDRILAAYVVPTPGAQLSTQELRAFVRQKLPAAFVPSEFLLVEGFPLSPNGKIDRKQLVLLRSNDNEALQLPRDDTERRIATLWERTLKRGPCAIDEDFFDGGGDSLTAIELLIRIESEFGTRLTLDKVLDGFTIGAVARLLGKAQNAEDQEAQKPSFVRLELSPGMAPVPVSPPQPSARTASASAICRIAELEDMRGIWEVCSRAFPAYQHASAEEFSDLCLHRWANNPARTSDDPFGWVLEAQSREIVGFHGLVPIRVWAGGRIHAAVSPTTWAADPGFGRAGLAMLARYMDWGKGRFLLNTTANAITSSMHDTSDFGMRRIPLDDFDKRLLWVRDFGTLMRWKVAQTDAPALLRRASELRLVHIAAGVGAPFALGMTGGIGKAIRSSTRGMRIRFACVPLQIEPIERFGPEFDELWDRLKHRYVVTMERTSSFLNWRHVAIPRILGKAFALACRDKGKLVGYVALREPASTAPGHFIVTDLFYDQDRPDVLHNLMNAAFDFAAARDASVFEVFGFHPSVNRELETQGPFVLRRAQLERLGRSVSFANLLTALRSRDRKRISATYWYRPPESELESVCSTGPWWPSAIDGDLNL
jgi:amino acid adenylation domain-containing protein